MAWYEKDTVLVIQWMMSSCTPTCLTMVMATKIYKHRNKSIHSDYSHGIQHLVGSFLQLDVQWSPVPKFGINLSTLFYYGSHCIFSVQPLCLCLRGLSGPLSLQSLASVPVQLWDWKSVEIQLSPLDNAAYVALLLLGADQYSKALGSNMSWVLEFFCFLYVPTFSTMFVSSTACILEVIDGV